MNHKKSHPKRKNLKKPVAYLKNKIAQSPGTSHYLGERQKMPSTISVVSYNEKTVQESTVTPASPLPKLSSDAIHWINIQGLADMKMIEEVCQRFHIHPLTFEDIFNTYHPAKFEEYDDYLFVVSKYYLYNSHLNTLEPQHVAIILKDNMVISFQDSEINFFNTVIERIKKGNGRIRRMQPDYLFYALIDVIVDQYFLVIETLWDDAEKIDDSIVENPSKKNSENIQSMKREMILFKKSLRPLRESISSLLKSDSSQLHYETNMFFRDLHDHIFQIFELTDTLYELLIESHNLYLSTLGQKTNEVMKVLTIIATIFIPLTFIVGVYGMNFENIPELKMTYGYVVIWGIMLSLTLLMLFFFKKKKWF